VTSDGAAWGAPGGDGEGLQAERTELAWVRTALACAALAALALRLVSDDVGVGVALGLGALVAVPGLVAAWWRAGELRDVPVPAPPRALGVAALALSVALVDLLVLGLLVW
jgi:uncharacterized membrane protein YidH (DUF202 family)